MRGKIIPELTVRELEIKARDFLRNHCLPGDAVDIDFIAEGVLKLEICAIPNLEAQHSTLGFLRKDEKGKYQIVIDQHLMNHNPNRYRFTVAEEIAHFILHRELFDKVKTMKDAAQLHNEINNYERADRNAKRFAAALLMPCDKVKKDAENFYSEIVNLVKFGDPSAVKKRLIIQLAKKYQVSSVAMKIRLAEWPVSTMDKIDNALEKHLSHLT